MLMCVRVIQTYGLWLAGHLLRSTSPNDKRIFRLLLTLYRLGIFEKKKKYFDKPKKHLTINLKL